MPQPPRVINLRDIEALPESREWAREDKDFDALRGDPEFDGLVAG